MAGGPRLGDRGHQARCGFRVFGPQVQEATFGAGCEPGDRHRLDDRERVTLEKNPILEGPWFGFVGVADEFVGTRRCGDSGPFAAGRDRRPSPAHESGCGYLVDDSLRPDLDRWCQGPVAAGLQVVAERAWVDDTDPAEKTK